MGRIAGLVTLETEDSIALLDAVKSVGSSIAMHVVAAKPLFLSRELVSASAIESEREILRTQVDIDTTLSPACLVHNRTYATLKLCIFVFS